MLGSLFDDDFEGGDSLLTSFNTSEAASTPSSSFPRGNYSGEHRWAAQHRSSRVKPTVTRPPEPRGETQLVGLLNQGATCYLNSLIQALFMTPEFRKGIFDLAPDTLGLQLDEDGFGVYSRKSDEEENRESREQRIHSLVSNLEAMGFPRGQSLKALERFLKLPDDQAVEKAVEWIFNNPADEADELPSTLLEDGKQTQSSGSGTPAKPPVRMRRMLVELQRLFARLQAENSSSTSTADLTKSFGWNSATTIQQHDVHELSRVLFDAIEESLRGTPKEQIINALYRGATVDRLSCLVCNHGREVEQYFQDIPLVVNGFPSIIHSLQSYTTKETLTGDNKYFCEKCNTKVDAAKGLTLRQLPQILVLSLLRFEYDFERDQRTKNCSQMHFPLLLDMAPYCDGGTPHAIDPEQKFDTLTEPPVDLRSSHLYELFAVIIHRGKTAQFGHYHGYIRDLYSETEQSGARWFDFDDSTVKPIEQTDLVKQYGGTNECAYMLVYRKHNSDVTTAKGLPPMPPHLCKEIAKANALLGQARSEYERIENQIDLVVHCPSFFTITDGILHEASLEEKVASDNDTTEEVPRSRSIVIDRRSPLKHLKDKIMEAFGELVPAYEMLQVASLKRMYGREGYRIYSLLDSAGDDIDLRTLGFEDGDLILAWDGLSIAGQLYDQSQTTTVVTVKQFSALPGDTEESVSARNIQENEFVLRVPEQMKIEEFADLLSTRTGIESSRLMLFKWSYRQLVPLNDCFSKTLLQVDLVEGTTVSVEEAKAVSLPPAGASEAQEKPNESQGTKRKSQKARVNRTLSSIKFQERLSQLEIFITDSFSGITPSPLYTTYIRRESSLLNLKAQAMKAIRCGGVVTAKELESARLRKALMGGVPGSHLQDESLTLRDAGIEDGQRIIVEKNDGSLPQGIVVRFVFGEGTKVLSDSLGLANLQRTISVQECKEMMLEKLKELRLIDNYDLSLFRIRKTDLLEQPGTILADEKGTLSKHQIADDDLLWIERGVVPVKGQVAIEFVLFSRPDSEAPMLWSPNVQAVRSMYAAMSKRSASSLEFLFQLEVNSNLTLKELKQLLLQQPKLQHLKGPEMLRLWYKERLLKNPGASLKKHFITTDAILTVQELSAPDDAHPDSLLLYVSKRIPETLNFEPPVELRYCGDNLRSLRKFLATSFDIPLDQLSVAKYLAYNHTWKSLDEDEEDQEQQEESKNEEAEPSNKHAADVRRAFNRLHIRDGDFIAVRDMRNDANLVDDFVMESIVAQKVGQSLKAKWNEGAEGDSAKKAPRPRPKEVGLKIDIYSDLF